MDINEKKRFFDFNNSDQFNNYDTKVLRYVSTFKKTEFDYIAEAIEYFNDEIYIIDNFDFDTYIKERLKKLPYIKPDSENFEQWKNDEIIYKTRIDLKDRDQYISKIAFLKSQKIRLAGNLKAIEPEKIEIPNKLEPGKKIVLLHELGILHHLKDKYNYLSVNRLAEIISLFIDEKQTTIQSNINPILSETKSLSQNNSPLTDININEIREILKSLGVLY